MASHLDVSRPIIYGHGGERKFYPRSSLLTRFFFIFKKSQGWCARIRRRFAESVERSRAGHHINIYACFFFLLLNFFFQKRKPRGEEFHEWTRSAGRRWASGRKKESLGRPIVLPRSGGVIHAPPTHSHTHGLTNFPERAGVSLFLCFLKTSLCFLRRFLTEKNFGIRRQFLARNPPEFVGFVVAFA